MRYQSGLTLELEDRGMPYLHLLHFGREPELFPARSRVVPETVGMAVGSVVAGSAIRRIEPLGMDRIILCTVESGAAWGAGELHTVRFDMTPAALPMAVFKAPGERLTEWYGPPRAKRPASPDDLPPAKPLSLLALAPAPPDHLMAEMKAEESAPETPQHTIRWRRVKRAARLLLSSVGGLDPVLCAALSRRFEGDIESIWPHLAAIGAACAEKRFSWRRYDFPEEGEAGRCAVYPVPLPVDGEGIALAGALEAAEARWGEVLKPSYVKSLRTAVLAAATRDLRKAQRLADRLAADLEDASRAKEYRSYGNLLVTYRHLMKRGMREIALRDFSGERVITIPLSPRKDPEQNIRHYFMKAKKGEKGMLIIRERKNEVARSIAEDRVLIDRIEMLREPEELIPLMPKRRDAGRPAAGPEAPPPFKRFVIDERYTVYIGRKDRENDLLTHRYAAPDDLWFHAQGVSGSHVILKRAGQSPPARILEIVAAIAAYFSKARFSSTVPVIYAEKRYVRKPRKSPPGTATCLRGKTIYVRPSLPKRESEQ